MKLHLKSKPAFGFTSNRDTQHARSVAYSVLLTIILFVSASCSTAPTPSPIPLPPTSTSIPPTETPVATLTLTLTPAPTFTLTPTPTPRLCSPLAVQPLDKLSEIITQPFKMPVILGNGTYKEEESTHHGVDLGYYTRDKKLFTGTPVLAALDGKIATVIHNRPPYGNMVILETPFGSIPANVIASQKIPYGDSLYTLYAHLQNLQPLEIGQPINCGQQLAQTGLTGFTGGPHLHFETRWGPAGQTFASMAYYIADTTAEERANYEKWRMSGVFHLFDPMDLFK